MAEMVRAFIGTPAPELPALLATVRELRALGRAVRVVAPGNWHVTLAFLGATPVDVVPELATELRRALAGLAESVAEVRGLGVFPSLQRPSVVWAGLPDCPLLAELAERSAAAAERLGCPRERRAFHPHLTLARVNGRAPRQLRAIVVAQASTRFGTLPLRSVVLYQSELAAGGSRYLPLATVPLTPAAP